MEKETKIMAAIVAVVFLSLFAMLSIGSGKDSNTSDSLGFDNWITLEVKHADGTSEPTVRVKNVVTNEGKNWIRDVLGGFSLGVSNAVYKNWTYIELSIDGNASAATDTACPNVVTGNGLGIGQATTIYKTTTGNYTASITYTVTGTQNGIAKVCLSNNSASAGVDLMASAVLSSAVNVANTDSLVVNYSVAVT